jgi:Zn-dependent peptidase ImmA (M78 family)
MKANQISDEDREANLFAIALLMPEELVRKEVAKLKQPLDLSDDNKGVKQLAQKFGVSITLMAMRLGELYLP